MELRNKNVDRDKFNRKITTDDPKPVKWAKHERRLKDHKHGVIDADQVSFGI